MHGRHHNSLFCQILCYIFPHHRISLLLLLLGVFRVTKRTGRIYFWAHARVPEILVFASVQPGIQLALGIHTCTFVGRVGAVMLRRSKLAFVDVAWMLGRNMMVVVVAIGAEAQDMGTTLFFFSWWIVSATIWRTLVGGLVWRTIRRHVVLTMFRAFIWPVLKIGVLGTNIVIVIKGANIVIFWWRVVGILWGCAVL